MHDDLLLCKICQSPVEAIGHKLGLQDKQEYFLFRCTKCQYAFVSNPRTDYAAIYSEAYYHGMGIDPFVDYIYELNNPKNTIRHYEWRGILQIVRSLFPVPLDSKIRWLDYGCGNGGLVRYIRSVTDCEIVGYDDGWIVEKAVEHDIPITRQKTQITSVKYDIVTAIEVLEHVEDPLATLNEISSKLVPGGMLFITTGNAEVHRNNLLDWNYFSPEIHISLYEPNTLKLALAKTGFRVQFPSPPPSGWSDIIRFKILKNLGIRKVNIFEKLIPWGLVTPWIDYFLQISAHPIGWLDKDN